MNEQYTLLINHRGWLEFVIEFDGESGLLSTAFSSDGYPSGFEPITFDTLIEAAVAKQKVEELCRENEWDYEVLIFPYPCNTDIVSSRLNTKSTKQPKYAEAGGNDTQNIINMAAVQIISQS
ncbi:hypothetical protein CHH92_20830 [Bacillus sonorensis]|mgnify:CR=1 FL=1|uniref:hypothetical protein n=1 Tax=Bacillus sonorensis TaxID=119858 RepID=UPI000BA7544A|nr:hypothetical protein [Bacillus sonorensis]PAD58242.1 hypothetical protein CHH92_20830 [Bacillus sonorensis]